MIEKLNPKVFGPETVIEKINEIVDKVNALELVCNNHTHEFTHMIDYHLEGSTSKPVLYAETIDL